MSSSGKRKDEDIRASDDDSETHAPAKKVAKPADSSDVCNLEKMSSKGKSKDENFRASDDDSETPAQAKEFAKPDDIFICNISKNRRLSVRHLNGKIWIVIRQFCVRDGKIVLCKRGITLSLDQWNTLRNHEENIDKALSDLS